MNETKISEGIIVKICVNCMMGKKETPLEIFRKTDESLYMAKKSDKHYYMKK